MNWRERQALPGARKRFFFASVVPAFFDAKTGEKIDGLPAPDQEWKFVWPKRGDTYVKYPECRRGKNKVDRRYARLTDWQKHLVDHPVAA